MAPTSINRWLEGPLLSPFVNEATFDFYARRIHPQWRLKRVVCRVTEVRPVSASMRAITLAPNSNWQGFQPGQHVQVFVEIGGIRHTRTYSLCNAPHEARSLTIAIKRQPGGLVSTHLHDHLAVGDLLEIGQAWGETRRLASPDQPRLFIAGGSGITPVMSHLQDLAATRPSTDVVLMQYAPSEDEIAFQRELALLERTMPGFRRFVLITRDHGDRPGVGRFCADHLGRAVPDASKRSALVCGPHALVEAVRSIWQERAYASPISCESFSPPEPVDSEAKPVQLSFDRSGMRVTGRSGRSLLEQAEASGLRPASGCRMGICFTCSCQKRSGTVRNRLTGLVSSEPDELIRLCVSDPLSDVAIDL